MIEIKEISRLRKLKGITWNDLAIGLPVTGEALRVAITRGKIQPEYLPTICSNLGVQNKQKENDEEIITKNLSLEELIAQRVSDTIRKELKEKNAYVEKVLNELMDSVIHLIPMIDRMSDKIDKIERDIKEGNELIKNKKI